jgi:hypothetical protein
VTGFCEHGNELSVPKNVGKFFSSYETPGFPRMTQLHGVN